MIGSWADVEEALRRVRARGGAGASLGTGAGVAGGAGRDGRDGKDGSDGRDGRDGKDGVDGAAGGGSGVSDHGALTGLEDDDHPQYLTVARGDGRYVRPADLPAPAAVEYRQNVRMVSGGTYTVQADDAVLIVMTSAGVLPETAA